MAKVKGCVLNKKTAQVLMEVLRNETRLKGNEIIAIRRILMEKCKGKYIRYA